MASKSSEQKAIEKQIKEAQKHAQEAARREHAKSIVDAAKCLGSFRVMNVEAEGVLEKAIVKLKDSSKYEVTVDKASFDKNISNNYALICEELQQYGMITEYRLLGSFASLTLSETGKTYFEDKEKAEKLILEMPNSNRNMIFISHRTVDAPVADMIKDFLVSTGIPNERIFCSSLPGNDVNERIGPEVKQRLKGSTINILILSRDYYESAYCLNEAGIAWYLDEVLAIPIGLPEINHENMIGFLNGEYKLRRLDNDNDISYLYDSAQERMGVESVSHSIITRESQKLKDRYTQHITDREVKRTTEEDLVEETGQSTTTGTLEREEGVLLVYAADDPSGQIIMINTISRSGPSISTHGWEFNEEDTARESARWKGALDTLERYSLVEAENYKRQIFTVTNQGYKVAEQVKEKWDIDTSKTPDEYLK